VVHTGIGWVIWWWVLVLWWVLVVGTHVVRHAFDAPRQYFLVHYAPGRRRRDFVLQTQLKEKTYGQQRETSTNHGA